MSDDYYRKNILIPGLKHKVISVLDKGYIQLIDLMGSDEDIVKIARMSYKNSKNTTTTIRHDKELINYLMRHRHTEPFEMVRLTFLIHLPIHVWRQFIRHRTFNTYTSMNESSMRYTNASDDKHTTEPNSWRLQSKINKQGSSDMKLTEDSGRELSDRERELHKLSDDIYNQRLELGVAKEQARKDIPLSTYTSLIFNTDLHNLLHFLQLRIDETAQLEIREYANVILHEYIAKLFPWTYNAFVEYRLNSITLSSKESKLLSYYIYHPHNIDDVIDKAIKKLNIEMSTGEIREFKYKLTTITELTAKEYRKENEG